MSRHRASSSSSGSRSPTPRRTLCPGSRRWNTTTPHCSKRAGGYRPSARWLRFGSCRCRAASRTDASSRVTNPRNRRCRSRSPARHAPCRPLRHRMSPSQPRAAIPPLRPAPPAAPVPPPLRPLPRSPPSPTATGRARDADAQRAQRQGRKEWAALRLLRSERRDPMSRPAAKKRPYDPELPFRIPTTDG